MAVNTDPDVRELLKRLNALEDGVTQLQKQLRDSRATSRTVDQPAGAQQRAVIADLEQRLEKSTDENERAVLGLRLTRERLVRLHQRGSL
jgi:predicted  nucleic acid-binding Zn-ribbon protein